MLNKLWAFAARYEMLSPGDEVVCAVSGGADSIALLWAMYLLKDKLQLRLSAAHFNHGLRGAESDRDEAFVREFCDRYDIPLHCGKAQVKAGKKGLEAAAREARYAFLHTLPGKIATAHTADDNAETVLMHLVRGTGLKGLGAIAPVNGRLIRPMLSVTREDVISFLDEYCLRYVTDSSNHGDAFLRNRIRHHVMPLLKAENPCLAENVSAMALQLRDDEDALAQGPEYRIEILRQMKPAQRSRALSACLEAWGVKEPERAHIMLAEQLVFSDKPSCSARFPGGITVCRNYDVLEKGREEEMLVPEELPCPGQLVFPKPGVRIICTPSEEVFCEADRFTVSAKGKILVRCRQTGDTLRLPGGTKSLKKLFIDRKIPANLRQQIPVIVDEVGVLGVWGIGPNRDRLGPGAEIRFENVNHGESREK